MTYANSNQNDSGKLRKFPEITQQKGYVEKFNQEKNLKFPPIKKKSAENQPKQLEKKPVNLGYQSEAKNTNRISPYRLSPQQLEMHEKKEVTSLSQDSSKSKKIIKWHMWYVT